MVIIYHSNTGFTRQYAEMLAKAEKLKAYNTDEAPAGLEEPVFFMGPLMAGHITGLDKAVKRYKVKGVCGVGMSPASQQVMDLLAKSNYTAGGALFYLQGGWAPEKVGWIKRRMVGMATKSIREGLQGKGSRRTPEEEQQLNFLIHGGSYVAYENLKPVQEWMKTL